MDKEKITLKSIRESFLFFGCDVSHLSDEELEERIIEGSKAIANTGITLNEAAENTKKLFMAMKL